MYVTGDNPCFRRAAGGSFKGPVVLVKKCEGANTGLSDSIPPVALRLRSRGAGLGWLWAVAAAFLIVSAGRMQAPQQASLVTGCFYWTAYRYGILWRVPGGTGGNSTGVVVVLVVNNQPCVKNLTLLYFFIESIT